MGVNGVPQPGRYRKLGGRKPSRGSGSSGCLMMFIPLVGIVVLIWGWLS
jgi:hypothetical protein